LFRDNNNNTGEEEVEPANSFICPRFTMPDRLAELAENVLAIVIQGVQKKTYRERFT